MHPDEAAFQAAMDADRFERTNYLVFADWLQDRGDERAAGYRAMAVFSIEIKPYGRTNGSREFSVWRTLSLQLSHLPGQLATTKAHIARWKPWFEAIAGSLPSDAYGDRARYFLSTVDVRNALALAWLRLTPAQQAEILTPALPNRTE